MEYTVDDYKNLNPLSVGFPTYHKRLNIIQTQLGITDDDVSITDIGSSIARNCYVIAECINAPSGGRLSFSVRNYSSVSVLMVYLAGQGFNSQTIGLGATSASFTMAPGEYTYFLIFEQYYNG